MEKKFKILKEYRRFYLAVDENGFKECFSKALYKPENGYIIKKIVVQERNPESYRRQNINREFNNR